MQPKMVHHGPMPIPKKSIMFLLALLYGLVPIMAFAQNSLIVGIYQNKPLVFVDRDGKPRGIYIDVLEAVAAKEGWQLVYHRCEWSACLADLENAKIDLLTGIAYSKERELEFDFSSETLLTNWAQIYAAQAGALTSFLALSGKKLAVVEGDIYYETLRLVADRLNIHPQFVEVENYDAVLRLVDSGAADAGMVPRIFGSHNETAYHIIKTPINFSPVELRFAAPKGLRQVELAAIDHHLAALKKDTNSIYYGALDYWLEGVHKLSFPGWLKPVWVIGAVAGVILIILVMNFILRWQVRLKTEALRASIAARERIQSDLRIAREIQRDLLPKDDPPFPGHREFDLYALIEPAKEVGGDFYDFFFIDTGRLCLIIGDVSDKGVPAALFMARAKTLLKASSAEMSGLGDMLSAVNRELCENNAAFMFVTVFCAVLNTRTGDFTYSNAGHNPPLVSRTGNAARFLKGTPNPALGIDATAVFKTDQTILAPGDGLLLYTDGITEAFNADGETFSDERLIDLWASLHNRSARAQVQSIFTDVKAFSGNMAQTDDIALVSVRYVGAGP